MPIPRPPKAVLIGRTNVGKSSLFNRIVEEQKSLVSPLPGTTRDRFEADCLWRAHRTTMVDTGGLDVDVKQEIEHNVVEQANIAIKQADIILFVVDVNVGPTAEDLVIAKKLQSTSPIPVIVVGNKADNAELRRTVEGPDWSRWPLKRPMAVSAKQGTGVGDLLDEMTELLEKHGKPPIPVTQLTAMRIAVLGEPNVGKSTLLNAVMGEERFITANLPHTTREPNDVLIENDGRHYLFIDTAGVRKQASRKRSGTLLENRGVEKTLAALERADVAIFVLDATKGVTAQDRHLAGVLADNRVSVVMVINKWDLIPNKTPTSVNEYEKEVRAWLPQLSYAPVLFTSALTGQRAHDIYKMIDHVYLSRFTELSDEEARSFLSRAIVRHKPQRGRGVKHPQIVFFAQTGLNPPVFTLRINLPRQDALNPAYLNFLERLLREHYDFTGTPIRMRIEAAHKKSHTT